MLRRMTIAPLDDLLDHLAARAAAPLEEARALGGELYASPELYAWEVERIFRREWMCVARVEQLPEPGSWIAIDLPDEPLVITRDADGVLHALSRACPHRSQDLLNGLDATSGTTTRLTCPYHQWSFRLDGSCIGAPDMGDSPAFVTAECRLGELPLAEWQGFVFVSLDADVAPLATLTAGLDDLVGDLDLSTWRVARTLPWGELDANWKIVIENGAECYHHMGPHKDSLEAVYPHASVDMSVSREDHWIAGHLVVSPAFGAGEEDGDRLHPLFFADPAPGLSPLQRSSTFIAALFPMFFIAVSPDFMSWFQWYPTGPERHRLDIHLVIPPAAYAQPDREAVLDEIAVVINAIQAEDARNNAGVQRMVRSRFARGGPLARIEYPLWRFQRYLAARLHARTAP
jgi:phenylpropionate dioxygenase-like ring-hydroxylating dioxygenase large terminal subunit